MAEVDPGAAVRHGLTDGLVRASMAVRLASLLVVLVLPMAAVVTPRVVIAVALVAGWSLVLLLPGRRALGFLRRHPMAAVVDVLLAVGVSALVGVDSPLVFVTLSTALVIGVLLPPVAAAMVAAVLVLSYLLVALEDLRPGDGHFMFTLVLPFTYVVMALLGAVARRLHDAVLAEQAKLASVRAVAAAEAERARLARDMHDSVAKSLHGVALAAAALPQWLEHDPATAARHASSIQAAAQQASHEARALMADLRRPAEDGTLAERLRRVVTRFSERSGLDAALCCTGVVDVGSARARAEVVEIVAEALENVHRHARCGRVRVEVAGGPDAVEVTVTDDGRGFDPDDVPADRFGLRGMRERAATAGGQLRLASTPGSGTSVTVVLPAADRVHGPVVSP